MKRYRNGQWNGIYFGGGPHFRNTNYKPNLVFKEERLISLGDSYEGSALMRITLDSSGTIFLQTMSDRKDKWNLVLTFPQDMCEEYGICGPNGICRSRIDSPIRCQCLKGFALKLQRQWDLHDWSSGCTRTTPLNCQSGDDGFVEVRGVKYPDMLRFLLNTRMNLDECKAECLKNCSCSAYANSFITNGGSGCLLWFSDLIDTKELSAPDSKQNIYIRTPVSQQDSSSGSEEEEEEEKRPIKPILISIASGVLVSAFINVGVLLITRRKRQAVKRYDDGIELPVIKMTTIVQATNNFSMDNMIGVGGFGPVYKAWLLWKENKILELMDECLNVTFMESEVKRCMQVGLLCVQKWANDRPTMSLVVSMLGADGAILPEPKEPGFFIERSSQRIRSCSSPSKSENGTITITDLEAR